MNLWDLSSSRMSSPETVKSLICFIKHITEDHKRLNRLGRDDVAILADPIRKLMTVKARPKDAGKSWVYRVNEKLRIVGVFNDKGILIFKTIYGRGNPIDKMRSSIDITSGK